MLRKLAQWVLWTIFAAVAVAFVFDNRTKERLALERFRHTSESLLERKAADVVQAFRFLQVGLRNLALLPGLRDAKSGNTPANSPDAVASGRISAETRDTVQQFYNNLASLISVSEVYMIAKGFDSAKGETPVFMYDELIVDASAKAAGSEEEKKKDHDEPEEEEGEEYRYYEQALKDMEAKHPRFSFKSMNEIPFWISSPLRTCDNSQYSSKSQGDVYNAVGVAAVAPLYERSGEFKGIMSAVVRLNVFEAALLGVPFIPVTEEEKKRVEKGEFVMPEPSRFRLLSKDIGFDLMDRRSRNLPEFSKEFDGKNSETQIFLRSLELSNNSQWELIYAADPGALKAELKDFRVALFSKILLAFLLAALVSWGIFQSEQKKKQVQEITEHMEKLARGELNEQAVFSGTGEVQKLAEVYAKVVRDLGQKSQVAHTIATGDLRIALMEKDAPRSGAHAHQLQLLYEIPSSADKLGHAMKDMVESLTRIVKQILELSDRLEQSSNEIAAGSASLSRDSAHEALAVDEVSQLLQRLARHTEHTVTKQGQALGLSSEASEKAAAGAPEVHAITTTMREAQQAGERIGKVVKMIEDIAFQTNLLALNASVEAARAGKAGKGFAVVADEVRNLANRSSKAVLEVETLISSINTIIAQGASKTDFVEQSLQGIVEGTAAVSSILAEVSKAGGEEQEAIHDVSAHVEKLTQGTHRNSALSEELSASAVELRQQAQELHSLIANFKV
jgi:methyl-accepting chemotaxis protein